MSGAYDARWVRGPSDEVDAFFQGNLLTSANLTSGAQTVYNIFNGTSFYLNAVEIFGFDLFGSSSAGTLQLLAGPNAGNTVGAVGLVAVSVGFPTSAPSPPSFGQILQLSGLNYRNRTGSPLYLHASFNTPLGANSIITLNLAGGLTSLMS